MKQNASIKIALIGSQDSGKTTLASSILDSLIRILSGKLSVCDTTAFNNEYFQQRYSLCSLKLQKEHVFHKRYIMPFVMRGTPSSSICQYDLKFVVPGTNKSFMVQLIDLPGFMLYNAGMHHQNIVSILNGCDTIIVAIDTPYLMHAETDIRQYGNNIHDITNILCYVQSLSKHNVQVIYLPLKCEKWIHQGETNKVVETVSREYGNSISMLKNSTNVEIMIIPVETIGGIEFCEFRRAYMLCNETIGNVRLCSLLCDDKKMVALSDGKIVKVKEDECLMEAHDWVFLDSTGPTLVDRPVQWYELSKIVDAEYHPKNCEQAILHSIRFVFNLIQRKYETLSAGSLFSPVLIGNLSLNNMHHILENIECLIKNDVEGITMIQSIN